MGLFSQAAFYTTVNHLKDLPQHGGREVAFVGRSNAGKSSAINTLTNQVRLAYTSKTPGRTQHLNYFSLGKDARDNNDFLVDLPGYGYAKVPAESKRHWEDLLGEYLQTRNELCGLVVIMDCRHPLTELDEVMLDWFAPTGKPLHILLTKSDKLSRQQATLTLNRVKSFLGEHFPQFSVQLFSSLRKQGIEEAEAIIANWFANGQKNTPSQRGRPGAKS
jgi:GTP-binding protein